MRVCVFFYYCGFGSDGRTRCVGVLFLVALAPTIGHGQPEQPSNHKKTKLVVP